MSSNTEQKKPIYQVTLVGYGRYGNYIAPKYAKKGFLWDIKSVVDPNVSIIEYKNSALGKVKPNLNVIGTFEEWYESYFKNLPNEEREQVVVELALSTDIVLKVARKYIEAGVKNLVLPKPVVDSKSRLFELVDLVKKHKVKAAISSQWHYSSLPKIISRDIDRIIEERSVTEEVTLEKAVINFSKENGVDIAPAPLCELPHSIQILESIGLLTGCQRSEISGDNTAVYVNYHSPRMKSGLEVVAEMDYQRTEEQTNLYTQWDYQERTLKVYISNNAGEINPILEIDFWMRFSVDGESVTHLGEYRTYEANGESLTHGIAEDLLLNMHRKIYQKFHLSYEEFQKDKNALPIEKYCELAFELLSIHEIWESEVLSKDNTNFIKSRETINLNQAKAI